MRFISGNGPNIPEFFWLKQIEALKTKARGCRRDTEKWRASLSDAQRTAQGRLNLLLLARFLNELAMGWAKMSTDIYERIPNRRLPIGSPGLPDSAVRRCRTHSSTVAH